MLTHYQANTNNGILYQWQKMPKIILWYLLTLAIHRQMVTWLLTAYVSVILADTVSYLWLLWYNLLTLSQRNITRIKSQQFVTREMRNYRVSKWTSTTAFLALLDANFFTSPGRTMHTRTPLAPSSSAVTTTIHHDQWTYGHTSNLLTVSQCTVPATV